MLDMKRFLILSSLFISCNGFAQDQNQFIFESEPPVDCLEDKKEGAEGGGYAYDDYCVYKSKVGNIITIDVRVKVGENQTVFNIPYDNIRHAGVITQVYYNQGPLGKSQWFLLPYTRGIVLFAGSITLPINEWVNNGITMGAWIRVVILTSE